jgi:hypothetical protein
LTDKLGQFLPQTRQNTNPAQRQFFPPQSLTGSQATGARRWPDYPLLVYPFPPGQIPACNKTYDQFLVIFQQPCKTKNGLFCHLNTVVPIYFFLVVSVKIIGFTKHGNNCEAVAAGPDAG